MSNHSRLSPSDAFSGDDRVIPASSAGLLERPSLDDNTRNANAASVSRTIWLPLRRIAAAAVACAVLVVISVQFVDRPVATWVHNHLGDARFHWFEATYSGHLLVIGPFSLMASPAQALGQIAVVVLAMFVIAALAGRRARMRGRIILALTVSIFAAKEINAGAKWIFGRTWPESWLGNNPSWIGDGVYGFFLFHGGAGWGSFPSGHTAIITTPATILWVVWPELRPLWAAFVVVVITGLLGADYHFVSDIIGGLFLGTATGLGITALMLQPRDRLNWSILRRSAAPDDLAAPTRTGMGRENARQKPDART